MRAVWRTSVRRASMASAQATMLTIWPGTTITLRTMAFQEARDMRLGQRSRVRSDSRVGVRRDLDRAAQLAVDLHRQRERVAHQRRRIGLRERHDPRSAISPWPSACHSAWLTCGVTGLSSSTIASSASCRTARPWSLMSSNLRHVVEQFHQRGDRGVEAVAAAEVVADLVDRSRAAGGATSSARASQRRSRSHASGWSGLADVRQSLRARTGAGSAPCLRRRPRSIPATAPAARRTSRTGARCRRRTCRPSTADRRRCSSTSTSSRCRRSAPAVPSAFSTAPTTCARSSRWISTSAGLIQSFEPSALSR